VKITYVIPLELQHFRKNCFDAVIQYVRYADLENHLLCTKEGRMDIRKAIE
jgi:hypothetical protein